MCFSLLQFLRYNHRTFVVKSLSLSICFLLFSGCSVSLEETTTEENLRFVIILLDETDSFGFHDERGNITTRFWPEVIPLCRPIIDTFQPEEKFCVIGIDDHGFDTEDIRVEVQRLDSNQMQAHIQKKKLKSEVADLQFRKEKYKRTDLLNSLYHVAYLLNKEPNYRGEVVIFSDMMHIPWPPTKKEAKDIRFPQNTKIYCFYVNASGRNEWDDMINTWGSIFEDAGVEQGNYHFYQRGETTRELIIRTFGQ